MKISTKTDLRKQLKSKAFSPVYLLFGPETFLRDLAAKTITEFALSVPELRDFNENRISLNEVDLMEALSAAEQLPVGDEKRVVVITDLFLSTNRNRSSLKENAEDVIARYLDNPCESSVVVFVADEFDKRLKISKLFAEKAFTVEFKALESGEAFKWVREKMREAGVDADQQTINALVGLAGEDAGKLAVEVEKLATAALPEKIITLQLVERLVKHSRVLSNFDLTDHLVAGRREAALAAMRKILDDGAEPLMLLGLLSYNFRQLFIARELMNEGLERRDVVSEMGLRGNTGRLLAAARRAEPDNFEKVLKRIAKADLAIKTSVGTPRLQIEMLVCELALG